MAYKQNNLRQEAPFEAKLSAARPLDVSTMTDDQLHAELEKGAADVAAGHTRPETQVFDELRQDYGL